MSTAPSPHPVLTPHNGPVVDLGRMLVGLIVVALGVVFMLDAAGVADSGRVLSHWWPTVIVAGGLLTLLERPPAYMRGTVLVAIGAVALLFTNHVLGHSAWKYVWSAAVIAAGLAVLFRWHGRRIEAGAAPDGVIRSTAVFGGSDLASADQAFPGAWLTAIFGGLALDLREARPAPGGAVVNATVAFGGIDVLVPTGWRVTVRTVPIFGGVENKVAEDPPPADDAPTLHVDAVCIFGGVGIKHRK